MGKRLLLRRLLVIGIFIAGILTAITLLYINPTKNKFIPCFFYVLTGKPCMTCGVTRAVYALLRFDFVAAFHYHAIFTLLTPLFIYLYIGISINVFCDKKIIPLPQNRNIYLYGLLAALVIYWILRLIFPSML